MCKIKKITAPSFLLFLSLLSTHVNAASYYGTDFCLSAPAAGQAGSTALDKDDSHIIAWASGYTNLVYGQEVADNWKTPEKALGKAVGTSFDIVCLGRGGHITLTFPRGIGNRPGDDFAIFENGFSDTFLELAYVEVSSDGIHFVRFPNYSYTTTPVDGFGSVTTELIYGMASKYKQGFGHPFDLEELKTAYKAQQEGHTDFSASFAANLLANFPLLNLDHITHIRIVDIVGDGSAKDCRDETVYDPYPTTGSAGFDLDAIAVMHESFISYTNWAIAHGVSADGKGDSDGDGVVDFQEYMFGGDPNMKNIAPRSKLKKESGSEIAICYSLSRSAFGQIHIKTSPDLSTWTQATPLRVEQELKDEFIEVRHIFSWNSPISFFRIEFE